MDKTDTTSITSFSYDFTTKINREGQGSAKWNLMHEQAEDPLSEGIVPFSVADMELPHPPEVITALHTLLDTTILGYTVPTDSYFQSVIEWQTRRHNWTPQKEWIVTSPGVVPAFHAAIRAFSKPGDGVIIQQPVYYPFMKAITINDRIIVNNALINNKKERCYQIDFADLEQKASNPHNKILLLCSPHNPVGRVWTRNELQRIVDICLRHDVFIISDEIHNDLIMPGYEHTTLLSLVDEVQAKHTMVCTAPSKTFNLAGFQTSNIFIPDADCRKKFQLEFEKLGLGMLNAFGYTACEAAYNNCEVWLEEVLRLI
ncbi:MalY/PatB family protein [Atopobium fossor]|uniref:MalY/PatB family protein n=1 Tax=Atopobium fossor TaxID=39487 RepID=UPI001FE22A5E|nr:aminotransferase class I/II-fold pyridoxal phosphate-dependent enzyme [Atopobium fossor]